MYFQIVRRPWPNYFVKGAIEVLSWWWWWWWWWRWRWWWWFRVWKLVSKKARGLHDETAWCYCHH